MKRWPIKDDTYYPESFPGELDRIRYDARGGNYIKVTGKATREKKFTLWPTILGFPREMKMPQSDPKVSMQKLNCSEAVKFWQKNDEVKKNLDRIRDPEGLSYGFYDDFPHWINRYYAFFQALVIKRFLNQINLSEDDRILEIGCGSGRWCHEISRQSRKSDTGLDISNHLLQNNRKYYDGKIDFLNAPASALPLRSNIFDLVFSVAVIQHLPPDAQRTALSEIHRIVKPGKTFFMIESTEMDSSSDHLYPRSFKDWKKLLQDHDFRILDATGQEYIDFRKIIRPVRRKLKSLIEMALGKGIGVRNRKQKFDSDEDTAGANANIFGLSLTEKLFHLLFIPLVLATYPLEFGLFRHNNWDKANYACLLARKK